MMRRMSSGRVPWLPIQSTSKAGESALLRSRCSASQSTKRTTHSYRLATNSGVPTALSTGASASTMFTSCGSSGKRGSAMVALVGEPVSCASAQFIGMPLDPALFRACIPRQKRVAYEDAA
jgi:hypothetical protein